MWGGSYVRKIQLGKFIIIGHCGGIVLYGAAHVPLRRKDLIIEPPLGGTGGHTKTLTADVAVPPIPERLVTAHGDTGPHQLLFVIILTECEEDVILCICVDEFHPCFIHQPIYVLHIKQTNGEVSNTQAGASVG